MHRLSQKVATGLLIGLFIMAALPARVDPKQSTGAQLKKPAPDVVISQIAWLTGKWRSEKAGRLIDEQWMAPAGGVMLGMARTVERGRTVAVVFEQIREGPGGDLFYISQAGGTKQSTFKSVRISATEVVFLNQLQEFPQSISYLLSSTGTLQVIIEGTGEDGDQKRQESVYQRVTP